MSFPFVYFSSALEMQHCLEESVSKNKYILKFLFLLGYLILSLPQHFKMVLVDIDCSFKIKIIQ